MSCSESDWKVFKELQPVALDRLAERSLAAVRAELVREGIDSRDRLEAIERVVREHESTIRGRFDIVSRSRVRDQLIAIKQLELLTDAEMSRFSADVLPPDWI